MKNVRTRFAPAPTGLMHIGNIRTALLNYIFAKKNNGTFVLRIEDTDSKRDFDPGAKHILKHLNWLGLTFQEGPNIGGPYEPYFQSKRLPIYQKYLETLQKNNSAYRCFCTHEQLEQKRKRQIALKKPPRYDRTCLKLTENQIEQNLTQKLPFVWRIKIDSQKQIEFQDLARKTLTFDLKNFSDFPITREDGSFTFIFANCVDDAEMNITHVLRGEDHLTNTVCQVVLLQELKKQIPIFWHLSILCNIDGKKLSKRDNGFSLEDLENNGFLPEAICNYLGIIGGSFTQEILSLDELIKIYNFENIHTTSHIKYDLEKLRWINHKWITQLSIKELTTKCKPFLNKAYNVHDISEASLECLIASIQTDLHTLNDSVTLLQFYFKRPQTSLEELKKIINPQKIEFFLTLMQHNTTSWNEFSEYLLEHAPKAQISNKELFSALRYLLTGSTKGLQIVDLFTCLGNKEFFTRLTSI